MAWEFHPIKRDAEGARLSDLEQREIELVRRLVTLKERRAFFPNEVSERQVTELEGKLTGIRAEMDVLRSRDAFVTE